MTVQQTYENFVQQLMTVYEDREAQNITDWVIESVAGIKRLERVTNKTKELDHAKIKKLDAALSELLEHKPVQYVLQEAWFYKMKFVVNEYVLIPRPETEELVSWIVEEVKLKGVQISILDIGTGSGCIPISLKKSLPKTEIAAIDVSEDALLVAIENANRLNAVIGFKQVNFLDRESWRSLNAYDIIVSNPPYIPEKERSKLDKNVVEHEPHVALFVKDNDPFVFYRAIIDFAENHLKNRGKIYVEVHEDYSNEVAEIFRNKNFKAEIRNDIHGRSRMVKAFR